MSKTNLPLVNGRHYPLYQQFVDRKSEFIGGTLLDHDQGNTKITIITDITLEPNGKDSAYFAVIGEDYQCGFDVKYGGIGSQRGPKVSITFSGYQGHQWTITKKEQQQ